MTVYELERKHKENYPNSHFFDKVTLKFFGECMSRMNVLKKTVTIRTISGEIHECLVLSKLGKDAFGKKKRSCAYFDKTTYQEIIPEWIPGQ